MGAGILVALVAIVAWVADRQSEFEPWQTAPEVTRGVDPRAADPELPFSVPDSVEAFGRAETFGPETLADKIDGRADLYLVSGFEALLAQRFRMKSDPGAWMEVFDYHMASFRQAFSVYSRQKRADSRPAGPGAFSYTAGPALFMVAGDHYVEIVSASESDEVASAMIGFGRGFERKYGKSIEGIRALELLPAEHRIAGTETLLVSDVFGFARLDQVFSAMYDLEPGGIQAWVSERKSPEAAASLARAWVDFLVENGGVVQEEPPGVPGATVVGILDSFELVFVSGSVVAGVHDARSDDTVKKLGLMLQRKVGEGTGAGR